MNQALDYDRLRQPSARGPLGELLALAAPTIAQMASYNVMQFVDTWMLSHLGTLEPTAASNGGMLAFAVIAFGMGVLFLVNTLVSQSYGRGDHPLCGVHLWQGLWFAVAYSAMVLPAVPFARGIFTSLGHEPALVAMESPYFQVLVGAAVLKLAATALGQYLLAINRPGKLLLATVAGVSVNVLAAWCLIFGNLGSPRMGVLGAGWAQNIGVSVELLVLIVFVASSDGRERFGLRRWRPRWRQFSLLLRLGVPSGVLVVADAGAWSLFLTGVMGVFGSQSLAANTFVMRYWSVSFMPVWGLTNAVTALVGRYIGMGRHDLARRRAYLGFVVGACYMIACGIAFLIWRHELMRVFAGDAEIVRLGAIIFLFAGAYQIFDAMYMIFSGALRGAGDTLVPAIATGSLCWTLTVAGGYAVAKLAPELGPSGPWSAATVYGIVLGLFMWRRFARGKWQSIHLEQPAAEVIAPPAPEPAATMTERVG